MRFRGRGILLFEDNFFVILTCQDKGFERATNDKGRIMKITIH